MFVTKHNKGIYIYVATYLIATKSQRINMPIET